ncbi:MAG: ArsR/SmtB family transcription factor [Thermoplasmata archaeon]
MVTRRCPLRRNDVDTDEGEGNAKAKLYKAHAEMCKTFASPTRLEIFDILRAGEHSVSELSRRTGVAQPTVSQHLNVMVQSGVLMRRKEGLNVYYRVANPKVVKAFELLREALLERLASIGSLAKDMGVKVP